MPLITKQIDKDKELQGRKKGPFNTVHIILQLQGAKRKFICLCLLLQLFAPLHRCVTQITDLGGTEKQLLCSLGIGANRSLGCMLPFASFLVLWQWQCIATKIQEKLVEQKMKQGDKPQLQFLCQSFGRAKLLPSGTRPWNPTRMISIT